MKPQLDYYKGVEVSQRTTTRTYVIRNEHTWMATIFLDDNTGEIAIRSDYGDYGYRWCSRGRDTNLRQFLVGTNLEYVADKFSYGTDRHFFADETVDAVREQIIQKRKERELDKEQAREMWNELKDADLDGCKTPSEFYMAFQQQCPETNKAMYDEYPYELPIRTGFHPQLQSFMERTWPHFLAMIKKELAEEKTVAQLPELL